MEPAEEKTIYATTGMLTNFVQHLCSFPSLLAYTFISGTSVMMVR